MMVNNSRQRKNRWLTLFCRKQYIHIVVLAAIALAAPWSHASIPVTVLNDEQHLLLPEMTQLDNRHASALIEHQVLPTVPFRSTNDINLLNHKAEEKLWLMAKVLVPRDNTRNYQLILDYTNFKEVDVYVFEKSTAITKVYESHTGINVPFSQRPVEDPRFIFPLKMQPGKEHFILLRVSPLALGPKIVIKSTEQHIQDSSGYYSLKGLIFGVVLVMTMYNLFLFATLRERIYGTYVFYMAACLLYIAATSGFGYYLLWPDFPHINRILHGASPALTYLSASIFIIHFLEVKKQNRYFLTILRGSIVIWSFYFILGLFHQKVDILHHIQNFLFLVFNIVVFGFALVYLLRGEKNARYFFASWSSLIILTSISSAAILGFIPYKAIYSDFPYFGICIESALFSFAIGERIKKEQMRRVEAQDSLIEMQKKTTRHLENKVAERTRSLEQQNQEILKQREEIKNVLTEKNTIFANISHELRTPLSLILGPLTKLEEEEKNPANLSQLQRIKDNGLRMLRLIEQLLSLSQSHLANKQTRTPQSLSNILSWVIANMSSLAEEKQQTITSNITPELWISAIPDSVEKIAINVLSNAIKYSPEGSDIHVKAFSDGACAHIEISDQGPGVAQDQRKYIFSQFARLPANETIAGSGIGLYVVKELVIANQGEVKINDVARKDYRTTFSISFPRIKKISKAAGFSENSNELISLEKKILKSSLYKKSTATSNIKPLDSIGVSENKPMVLVVDDNSEITEFMSNLLAKEYRCVAFNSSTEALSYASDNIPDLIITDFMMPEIDGLALSKELKNSLSTRHIPIIMLTARDDPIIQKQRLEEYIDEFVTKPFEINSLLLLIRNKITSIQYINDYFLKSMENDEPTTHDKQQSDSRDGVFMEKLNEIIATSYHDDNVDLAYLSEKLCLSPRPLQRKTKQLTGYTPMAYVKKIRIEKSKEMLKHSDMSISDIADATGFSSTSYFSRIFKEDVGRTPRQYRLEGETSEQH